VRQKSAQFKPPEVPVNEVSSSSAIALARNSPRNAENRGTIAAANCPAASAPVSDYYGARAVQSGALALRFKYSQTVIIRYPCSV